MQKLCISQGINTFIHMLRAKYEYREIKKRYLIEESGLYFNIFVRNWGIYKFGLYMYKTFSFVKNIFRL